MVFDKAFCIDLNDIAAQLGAEKRPHDGDQLAVGNLACIQELDDVVVRPGNIGAGGMAIRPIVELQTGAVRIGRDTG